MNSHTPPGTSLRTPALVNACQSRSALLGAILLVAGAAIVLADIAERHLETIKVLHRGSGRLRIFAELDEPGLEVGHIFQTLGVGLKSSASGEFASDLEVSGNSRLQGVAEPDMVVIAESTRRLLGTLFDLEDQGAQDLKGIAGPVRAWAALRQASVEGRFEAFHASGLTELVGREEEVDLLLRRWSKAKTGEGQVVLLSGEAGIGKSRLTAELLERLATESHTRLRYFCSPQHTDSALYPIISQMERAAGFTHDDTAQGKLDKLDAALALAGTFKQDAALFAEMLSLPNGGRYPRLELTPQQRRQKTLEALTAQMEALTRQNPVLMIVEDAHWIDPTSLEALAGQSSV